MAATTTIADIKAGGAGQSPAKFTDIKPKEQIAYLLKSKQAEIEKMLPKHLNAERLLKVAQIAATTTPALAKCDVASLIGAIGQCAQMGLEPNTVLGHAYLVPFNVKRKDTQGNERWVNSVQVVIGYKGLIDLARRSGQIVSIAAHEVGKNDDFELVYGLDEKLNHTPAMGERGEVIGFYAVAKLKDGGHCFEFMSLHQVREIMASTQSKGKYGPWKDHFIEMGRKTAIRRIAKYLPLSVEFQTAAALDSMAEGGRDQHIDAMDGDFSVIPDDAPYAADPGDEDAREVQQLTEQQPTIVPPMQTGNEAPEYVDRSTGEIVEPRRQRAEQPAGQPAGPGLADAQAAVRDGDFDMARDIARSLPPAQRQQVEESIARATAPATGRRDRAQRGLSLD